MTLDGTEVRKGLTGHLYMGAVGVTMPTDTATALNPSFFVELGYTSEDAIEQGVDTQTSEVPAWQSLVAVRKDVTSQTHSWVFTLIQRNRETLQLAFGGGSFSNGATPGDVIYTPPAASAAQEHAFVFEIIDGNVIDRIRLGRGSAELSANISFKKDDAVGFEITVTALAAAGDASPWDLITNDPAMAA